jgi:hypothetical protein
MSMRSISGPEIFDMYLWIWGGVQKQSRRKSFAKPQGQGFEAATKMNDAGKVSVIWARAIISSFFKRLAKDLKNIARKLGKLIEEKHAVVSHAHFAGAGNRATTNESGIGDCMVR